SRAVLRLRGLHAPAPAADILPDEEASPLFGVEIKGGDARRQLSRRAHRCPFPNNIHLAQQELELSDSADRDRQRAARRHDADTLERHSGFDEGRCMLVSKLLFARAAFLELHALKLACELLAIGET